MLNDMTNFRVKVRIRSNVILWIRFRDSVIDMVIYDLISGKISYQS